MSLTPYPSGSSRCGAEKTVLIVPWVEGIRRPEAAYRQTVYCDKPSYHVVKHAEPARRHYDQTTLASWDDEADEGREEQAS